MDFLGIFSSALLLFLLLLIVLNIYCIHAYYKMNDKINEMYFIISSIRKDVQTVNLANECKLSENKEISVFPENFIYYPKSPSSLIEVSSDDENDYDNDSDNSIYDNDNNSDNDDNNDDNSLYNLDDCEIKNVHLELNLEKLEDINVSLLEKTVENTLNNDDNVNDNKDDNKNDNKNDNDDKDDNNDNDDNNDIDDNNDNNDNNNNDDNKDDKEINLNNDFLQEVETELGVEVDVEVEELVSSPKELNFKPKKRERESRKNIDGDYKKMNLTDLRKYVVENNINIDVSKMKKPEILKAMEELKNKSVEENNEILL